MAMQVAVVVLLEGAPHSAEEHFLLDDGKVGVVVDVQERGLEIRQRIKFYHVKIMYYYYGLIYMMHREESINDGGIPTFFFFFR